MEYDRKRVYRLYNQWTHEKEFWLTPSINVGFYDGFSLDVSFLIWKLHTFNAYTPKG